MQFIYKGIIALLLVCGLTFTLYAQIPSGYYNGAQGLYGDALKAALNDIIDNHTEYPYTADGTDVWDILKESDQDPENSDNVILIYTGSSVDAAQEYNSGNGWTREHVWAKSHGDFGIETGAGTDLHNLKPCDQSVNSSRSNLDFDDGGVAHAEATECYYDSDSWEPRDEVKGDVARMIFYMMTRYEGENGEVDLEAVDYVDSAPNDEPYHGKVTTLMDWHEQDPPDDFERARNEVIYSYQGNRNPYIDHPEYVYMVWEGLKPEPTNNVTNLQALKPVSLSWQSAGEGATHYLIMKNTEGCNAFSIPNDGEAYADHANQVNITADQMEYTWHVEAGVYTYFMIIPYNQDGYNYKTDGEIPCLEFVN